MVRVQRGDRAHRGNAMMLRAIHSQIVAVLCFISCAIGAAFAGSTPEPWHPTRPLRMVVPFAPGGGADAMARLIQPKLVELTGQPIVIDNRAGASGNIGAELVAKSPPD